MTRVRAKAAARRGLPAALAMLLLAGVARAALGGASHHLHSLNEPGWALNVFWLPEDREEGVRRARVQARARQAGSTPGPAGPRWNQMGD